MNELRGLPEFLIEVAEVTGKPKIAWALLHNLGGTQIYIPQKITEKHPLAEILGFEDALLLAKHFAGSREDIPTCAALNSKKMAILESTEKSTRKLALELKCTERYVRSIKNPPVDKNQISMFDEY